MILLALRVTYHTEDLIILGTRSKFPLKYAVFRVQHCSLE